LREATATSDPTHGAIDPRLHCIRAVASGGASGARPPHMKSVLPHFTFGPLIAAYIQYSILKMWPTLLVFGPSFWFLATPAAKLWRQACTACALTAFVSKYM